MPQAGLPGRGSPRGGMGVASLRASEGSRETPLILLPGMGADARLFACQRAAFENLRVPKWIEPGEREPLRSYARRMAAAVDPGEPCFVGGVSFGGFLAVEMAQHLDAKACFLIGGARSPRELPLRVAAWRAAAGMMEWLPWARIVQLAGFAAGPSGAVGREVARSLVQQLAECDGRFLRWAAWAVLTWERSEGESGVPVYHIHGDCDWMLPCRGVRPDRVVRGAGHALVLTHADQVNGFLREGMRRQGASGNEGMARLGGHSRAGISSLDLRSGSGRHAPARREGVNASDELVIRRRS